MLEALKKGIRPGEEGRGHVALRADESHVEEGGVVVDQLEGEQFHDQRVVVFRVGAMVL